MSAALKFASVPSTVAPSVSIEETAPVRDPKIQAGWDLAKEFTAAQLVMNALPSLLRQAKDNCNCFIYPNNEPLPNDPFRLANLVKETLEHTGKEKLNCLLWSSYEALCSKTSSSSQWNPELPYPSPNGTPVEFHSVGALGSNEIRKIINEKILPELGLDDFVFRSYPGFEFWNKKKHNQSQRGAFGRLVGPDGEPIPATRIENAKKVRRYDVSLVVKPQEKRQTTQKIKFACNSVGSDSDE